MGMLYREGRGEWGYLVGKRKTFFSRRFLEPKKKQKNNVFLLLFFVSRRLEKGVF